MLVSHGEAEILVVLLPKHAACRNCKSCISGFRTCVQVELDNTAADFRRLHTERQDLVRQWQNAIDGMRRRDDEINAVGEKYAAARQVRASRIETLAQNAARLKMQKNDNKEVIK